MGVTSCIGGAPDRGPPSDSAVQRVRAAVAAAVGLRPAAAELHHSAAPWRYRLIGAVQDLSEDPDTEFGQWLQHGAPMGIKVPIAPVDTEITSESIFDEGFAGNHSALRRIARMFRALP